jgi:hypothetical protein
MFCDNLVWFGLLWVIVLVGRHLQRAAHQPTLAPGTPSQRKTARPLKPRTPNDCPVCGRSQPTPLWGNLRKAGCSPAPRPAHLRVRLTLASDGRVVVDRTAIVNVDLRLAI